MTAEFQIRQYLGGMDREKTLYRLVLDDDGSFDQHVDAIADFNSVSSVVDWEVYLRIDPESRPPQVGREASLIG